MRTSTASFPLTLLLLPLIFAPLKLSADGSLAASYVGDGCPVGSVSATLSGNNSLLSITFASNVARASAFINADFSQKSCRLQVPIKVQPKSQVAIVQTEYVGVNRLPSGAVADLLVDHFFAGGRGPQIRRHFEGTLFTSFRLNDELRPQARTWSPCGQDVVLQTTTQVSVAHAGSQEAASGFDRSIGESGLFYRLEWRPCR